MKELELLKKIDEVLSYLNAIEKPGHQTDSEIEKALNARGIIFKNKELLEILNKLKKDDNAFGWLMKGTHNGEPTEQYVWYSTFEGQLLEISGGYTTIYLNSVEVAKEQGLEKARRIKFDQSTVENQVKLNDLTLGLKYAGYLAAAGTGFLGLMELVKYFHLFESCCCH